MTTIFSDDFESGGFANWTAATTSGVGSTLTAILGAAYSGSFGARSLKPTGSNNGYARAEKSITYPASNVIGYQFRFYVNALGGGGGDLLAAQIYKQSPTFQPIVGLGVTSGQWYLRSYLKDATQVSTALSSNISTGAWHLVELVYDNTGSNI